MGSGSPLALEVCGPQACGSVLDPHVLAAVPLSSTAVRRGSPPAAPGPYYELELAVQDGAAAVVPGAFYVRLADAVRVAQPVTRPAWAQLPPTAAAALRAVTEGVRPYAVPRVATVLVGARTVRSPQSYLRLYSVGGTRAVDPAGTLPPAGAGFVAWRRWNASVRRFWLPVVSSSLVPSPWTGSSSDVWISRRGSLLKRDGEVLRIDAALAVRARRGLPLR